MMMKRRIASEDTIIRVHHAVDACEEMVRITDEFRTLAQKGSVPTPALDRLNTYLDPDVEPIADGGAAYEPGRSGPWLKEPSLI